jgi:hypothetical protein
MTSISARLMQISSDLWILSHIAPWLMKLMRIARLDGLSP